MKPQTLLFDADDTLWSNGPCFDRARAEWLRLMVEQGADESKAQEEFLFLEAQGFRRGLYGSRRLRINMKAAARHALGDRIAAELEKAIDDIVEGVRRPVMHVFDGVAESLEALGQRHTLLLVTMGEKEEQLGKLSASGLGDHFSAVHVFPDKTRRHYETIVRRHRLERRDSWMIGNSMAKDIRPARASGLKTCHIANGHDFSFGVSRKQITPDLIVDSLSALPLHFLPSRHPGQPQSL